MTELIENARQWLSSNDEMLWWSGALSAGMFLATLIALPLVIIWLPRDYFVSERRRRLREVHPALRWSVLILKNVLGVMLLLLGVVMLVTPGQGLLSIVIGLSLMNFPGKYHLQRSLLRRQRVLRTLNWIRRKAHKPPLHDPDYVEPLPSAAEDRDLSGASPPSSAG